MAKKRITMGRLLARIEGLVSNAWGEGRAVEVWVREKIEADSESLTSSIHNDVGRLDPELEEKGQEEKLEDVELNALADHEGDHEDCPGAIGTGGLLRIRNGITMGSGSEAFVMPPSWPLGWS